MSSTFGSVVEAACGTPRPQHEGLYGTQVEGFVVLQPASPTVLCPLHMEETHDAHCVAFKAWQHSAHTVQGGAASAQTIVAGILQHS